MVEPFLDQTHAGEFNLLHFSVSLARPWTGKLPGRDGLNRDQRMANWMEYTSLHHEYRHFHDLVGTSCGLHTMLRVTRLVDWFLDHASKTSQPLRVPVRQRDPGSRLLAVYDGHMRFLRATCGDLPVEAGSSESAVEVREIEALGARVKVPYCTLTDQDPASGAMRDRLVPVGMRALMEATAIETQIFLSVVGSGPLEAADEAEEIERGERIAREWTRIVRGGYLVPYAVCEFLFHYWTRQYPFLGVLTGFSEAALMYSGYSEAAFPLDPPTFDPPGFVFTNLAAAHANLGGRGTELELVNAAAASFGFPTYEEVVTRIADRAARDPYCVAPADMRPDAAHSDFIAAIRQFLFRDFAAIAQVKASAPESWMLAPDYLRSWPSLPRPPLVAIAGSIASAAERKELTLWALWIFLLAMLADLIEKPRLECPIRYRLPALGSVFSFPDPARPDAETDCLPFIERKCCGVYDGAFGPEQPAKCPFRVNVERMLGWFAFEKIEFPKMEQQS